MAQPKFPLGSRVTVNASDTMNQGRSGLVVAPSASRMTHLSKIDRRRISEGALLIESDRGELFVEWANQLEDAGRSNISGWSVEAGRTITFDGEEVVHLTKEGRTRPIVADGLAYLIVDLLNGTGATPESIYERHMGRAPRRPIRESIHGRRRY